MLPMKLDLTEELAATLRQLRLDHPVNGEILTAEKLSRAIGNNRAWMSQIESRRLKKIKREDIIKIYKLLFNYENDQDAEDKAELELLKFFRAKDDTLLFGYKHHDENEGLLSDNSNTDTSDDISNEQLSRISNSYITNCKKISDLLIDIYKDKEKNIDKAKLALRVRKLLELLYDDNGYFLELFASIPFELYQYANETDKIEIDKKAKELTDTLNKLKHKKLIISFVDRIEFILEELSQPAPKMKIINDNIILCVIELSDIIYEYPIIPMNLKSVAVNELIKMLDEYSQKTSMVFTLKPIPEENTSMDDINNAIDYIQSFVNGIKDSSAFLLNRISDYYKDRT